ncbi:MAG: hypothetical protein CVV33_09235 [Methanomicrobiales archaeon HGW-Methanomicrobiales-4]|nr:MAG: hypothetical protein CVV33_09235 [Methanomicrobiales archaeon HGW-Methanomicrobiales-4]
MACIEEKITRLSPAGKDAAEAFIDFLLSREKGEEKEKSTLNEEEEGHAPLNKPEPALLTQDMLISSPVNTGIILAEERMIEEKDDLIDFADINTRFTRKEYETEEPRPVRQTKKLDWL